MNDYKNIYLLREYVKKVGHVMVFYFTKTMKYVCIKHTHTHVSDIVTIVDEK